jgi:hypothetical protein
MHVTVAIPAYSGTVHLGTMRSLFTDLLTLQEKGIAWTLDDEVGNGLIAQARGHLVAKFLASDSDVLVFVDSDVCWEAGALVRLVEHPVDFVAGIYPQRRDPPDYCVKWLEKEELHADPETGLLEVEGVPAGFLKMSRVMLQAMVEHYPDTIFHCEPAPDKQAWHLFGDYRVGKYLMGEDYAFCRRWKDIGGKVWIDPEMQMGHVGNKTFPGHLGEWLRSRA